MELLGEDDLDLRFMTDAELEAAWDLWFDLAQETNGFDPPYTHGVFVWVGRESPPVSTRSARCCRGRPG